mgnify:CR=1 FL=1
MGIYVIAKKNVADLHTEVLHAGKGDHGEAAIAFTSAGKARNYIAASGWSDVNTVAELAPVDFLQWLNTNYHSGVQFLAVNPVRDEQEQGIAQPVLNIKEELSELAAHLQSKLDEPAAPPPMETREIDVFHCGTCGAVMRQPAGQSPPLCCDHEMHKPAVDRVQVPTHANTAGK